MALSSVLDTDIRTFLIRDDGEEDLMFALWTPSYGSRRLTALLHTPLFPVDGDRQRHGNVSFNLQYFERACRDAVAMGCGIAFLHSHPGAGWQGMSPDDVTAEKRLAGPVAALTNLPLVGLTIGSDGTWSGRMWDHDKGKVFQRVWCHSVRSVGDRLQAHFDDNLVPLPSFREQLLRTVTVWGKQHHSNLARLRVGIVGLGSVGSMVAETLARIGMEQLVLIDFDEVQTHNLDRLMNVTMADIGRLKTVVVKRKIQRSATAARFTVDAVPYSLAEEQGYLAALDCDVLFSCVDRPRARRILNHMAYAHLIPVIDGGIEVRFKNGVFSGVDWQLQTAAPGRPCLECLKCFDPNDVSTEAAGKLDDPSYLKGLPSDHRFKRNENIFPFSENLASLEVLQFVALATGIAGIHDFGVQRYRYNPGILDMTCDSECRIDCDNRKLIGQGDRFFRLWGRDHAAAAARKRQSSNTVRKKGIALLERVAFSLKRRRDQKQSR